jgi:hypothetical protein
MAKYTVLYWQDIPSVLIDVAAMRQGLAGTDAYLEQWRRGERVARDGSAEQVANAVKEELEAGYDALKAAALGKR